MFGEKFKTFTYTVFDREFQTLAEAENYIKDLMKVNGVENVVLYRNGEQFSNYVTDNDGYIRSYKINFNSRNRRGN